MSSASRSRKSIVLNKNMKKCCCKSPCKPEVFLQLRKKSFQSQTIHLKWQSCCKNTMYLSSAIQLLKNNYLINHHDGCDAGPKIGDITFSQTDIEETIDDMNRYASSTDHEIRALIIKECKNNISYPVFCYMERIL